MNPRELFPGARHSQSAPYQHTTGSSYIEEHYPQMAAAYPIETVIDHRWLLPNGDIRIANEINGQLQEFETIETAAQRAEMRAKGYRFQTWKDVWFPNA